MSEEIEPAVSKKSIVDIKVVITLILFILTFLAIQQLQSIRKTPITEALVNFPKKIGDWKFENSVAFSEDVTEMLKADDYINLTYSSSRGDTANLYISYYSAVGISGGYHSPMNCLPGGGVRILGKESFALQGGDNINMLNIESSGKKAIAFYWYYNRGRVIKSDYAEKFFQVIDAIFKNRKDGSFIRVIVYPKNGVMEDDSDYSAIVNNIDKIVRKHIPGERL